MVTTYAGLYAEAEKLEEAIQAFTTRYKGAVDARTPSVFAGIEIERQLVHLRGNIFALRKAILADAFAEGELVFTPPPAPEGSENVHKNDNVFVSSADTMRHIRDTIGRSSPVRLTSIL